MADLIDNLSFLSEPETEEGDIPFRTIKRWASKAIEEIQRHRASASHVKEDNTPASAPAKIDARYAVGTEIPLTTRNAYNLHRGPYVALSEATDEDSYDDHDVIILIDPEGKDYITHRWSNTKSYWVALATPEQVQL